MSGNCSLATVILAFGLGTDEGAYLHLQSQADASQICVVSVIQIFMLFVLCHQQ